MRRHTDVVVDHRPEPEVNYYGFVNVPPVCGVCAIRGAPGRPIQQRGVLRRRWRHVK